MTNIRPHHLLICIVIAFLLGIALVGAFAPFEIFPFAILAPAGLLALIANATLKRTFWLGFVFGLGLFGFGVYWVYLSIHDIGNVPIWLSCIITGGLIAILALFPASVCYLTNRYFPTHTPEKFICAFPAIWVLSEWIRSWVFSGFPWLFLGYSQTNSPLKGFAPLFSVYGVSLFLLITSGLIVNAAYRYQQKNYRSLYFNLLAIMIIWISGGLLSLIPWTQATGKPISVSLVQGNIPQTLKWSPEHLSLSFSRYTDLTEPLWKKDQWIIWPEAAIPMTLQSASDFINTMDNKATVANAHLILGIPIQNTKGDGYFNAIVTLGNDKNTYLKRRLVPFGEYVPFQQIAGRLFEFMNIPMSDLISGSQQQRPLLIDNVKVSPSICFEIGFPELIRFVDPTIGLLLTVTNDAWFGHSPAEAQHLQMAAMRAIELGRPVLFSSNNGITAIIDSTGNIVEAAPAYQPYVLNGTVQPTVGLTPWMRNGMDPVMFIIICFLIVAKRQARAMKKSLALSISNPQS